MCIGIGDEYSAVTHSAHHGGRYFDRVLAVEDSCYALCPPKKMLRLVYAMCIYVYTYSIVGVYSISYCASACICMLLSCSCLTVPSHLLLCISLYINTYIYYVIYTYTDPALCSYSSSFSWPGRTVRKTGTRYLPCALLYMSLYVYFIPHMYALMYIYTILTMLNTLVIHVYSIVGWTAMPMCMENHTIIEGHYIYYD